MNQRRKRGFFVFFWATLIGIALATLPVAQADLGYILDGNPVGESSLCIGCMDHIAMTSPTEGWAVGEGDYLLHDHGGRWTWVLAPGAFNFLIGITMSSSSEGWAVGSEILHYHAGVWTVARTLPDTMLLYDVALTSPTTGWAVGEQYQTVNGQQYDTGVIWRLADGAWAQFATFPDTDLYSVAVLSPDEAWAVGARWAPGHTAHGGVILHYSDGTWAEAGPATDVSLTGIAFAPNGDGWIAGSDFEEQGLFLRYHAGAWTETPRIPGVNLRAVTMSGDGDAWALAQQPDDRSLLLHYTGLSWMAVGPSVAPGMSGLALTGPGEGWAAGVMTRDKTGYGVLLQLRNGTWSPVTLPRQPETGSTLAVPVPAAVVLLSLLCLTGIVVLALALRAPRTSLWHTLWLRLALLGFICYGLVIAAGLIAGMIRDEYLFDLIAPVSGASIVSLAMLFGGLLGLCVFMRVHSFSRTVRCDPDAKFALRPPRSASPGSEPASRQNDGGAAPP